MILKLLTFNCRGMQDYFKRRKIFHYIRSLNGDIIFLQETHSDMNDERLWKSQWGEFAFFASFTSNSRGVAILIRNSLALKVNSVFKDPNGRFLILDVMLNKLPLTLINVYAPNYDDPNFLLEVFAEADKIVNPFLIVAGDFNSVLGPLDYQGSREQHSNSKAKETLGIVMDEYSLCDIWRVFHPNLKKYTRHQKCPKALSRLDFILMSENFVDNCKKSEILPGIQSDHSVVSVDFDDKQPMKGRGYWKLNTHYLLDPEFMKLIKEKITEFKAIHKDSQCNPNIIWDSFKCFITGVCIEYSTRKKKVRSQEKAKLVADIDRIKLQLPSSNNPASDSPLFSQLEDLETKLNKIYEFETKGLITRSKVRWLEEGERSNKYFCNLENRAWQKKTINSLKDNKSNNLIFDSKNILEHIHEFYSNLYSSQDLPHTHSANEAIFDHIDIPKLSEDDKNILEMPLTKNELFEVVKSMKTNKSPGFDGLPAEFYTSFWSEINDMLMNSFNFSLQSGSMSNSQRNGVITLLLKPNKDPLFIPNYRPITLLTTDYKILAKCLANRMKKFLHDLIHPDQSGFMKGRNIRHNIRLILDLIEYTDIFEIPGLILLLDIEKAFDSVSHKFLFQVLEKFNFGKTFINSIKTLYSLRQSYIINNGHLSERIVLERGIFQGCPISPYLFLLVIEIMALSIRQNDQIKGICCNNNETKISLFADDSVCFLDGSVTSFFVLFEFLDKFGKYSGCKINFNKTEAVWIGSKKGCPYVPHVRQKIISVKNSEFKCLGVNFSLNTNLIFEMNYKVKLKRIEQTINCWRMRNLSLIGKVCVIKSLVLPQLIYLFSVLCIRIPPSFFKELNRIFFKFIWSGGRDRVQRRVMCNDYLNGGLKMIDPLIFANAQKMQWVRDFLDDNFSSSWKNIENMFLTKFNDDISILWRSFAPEGILKSLGNIQIAETLRCWYSFREKASIEFYGNEFSNLSAPQLLWFNKLIRSKSKTSLFYAAWHDKKVITIADLFNPPFPGYKLFEELVLDFDIPSGDRKKYNFLIKCIPVEWIENFDIDIIGVHETIVHKLLSMKKVPQNSYILLLGNTLPEKRYAYWSDILPEPALIDWEKIHKTNFFCTIDTKMRSFYFKIFHNSIALNVFLHKIKRKESPNCSFCDKKEETIIHLFIECEKVAPLWQDLLSIISQKSEEDIQITNFEKMFGVVSDKFVSYLFLLLKYHVYTCKFSSKLPSSMVFKSFVNKQKEVEYMLARKKNKLHAHFKKWRFII